MHKIHEISKDSRSWLMGFGLFSLALCLVTYAWWSTVAHWLEIGLNHDTYSHILIVPFISIWLLYHQRDSWLFYSPNTDILFGAVGVLGATIIWISGLLLHFKFIEHFAYISLLLALVLGFFGRRFFQHNLFALLFLYLAIPFGYDLIEPLQFLTAKIVLWLLDLSQVPYQADGVLIILSSGYFEIARACAGIKFLFASFVSGILLAYLITRNRIKQGCIIGVSIFIPIIANALRVFGTLMIAEWTDESFAKNVDHIVYGWGFFAFVLFILIFIAYKLSDKDELESRISQFEEGTIEKFDLGKAYRFLGVLIVPIFAAYFFYEAPHPRLDKFTLHSAIVGQCETCLFRHLETHKSETFFSRKTILNANEVSHGLVRQGADQIEYQIGAFYNSQALMADRARLLGRGWGVLPGSYKSLLLNDEKWHRFTAWKNSERQYFYVSYNLGGDYYSNAMVYKLSYALKRLAGAPLKPKLFVLSIDGQQTAENADRAISKFIQYDLDHINELFDNAVTLNTGSLH